MSNAPVKKIPGHFDRRERGTEGGGKKKRKVRAGAPSINQSPKQLVLRRVKTFSELQKRGETQDSRIWKRGGKTGESGEKMRVWKKKGNSNKKKSQLWWGEKAATDWLVKRRWFGWEQLVKGKSEGVAGGGREFEPTIDTSKRTHHLAKKNQPQKKMKETRIFRMSTKTNVVRGKRGGTSG